MGCANSKAGDKAAGGSYQSGTNGGAADRHSHLRPETDVEAFREKLFAQVGESKSYAAGEMIIEEGKASENAILIRKGEAKVIKKGKEVAMRGKGSLVGEMTLLLGDVPGVSIIADTAVDVYVVRHSDLAETLQQDPNVCGRVFRMMAATLSERIGEASAKMRSEVVAKNAKKQDKKKPTADVATLNVAKYRQLFGLTRDENLMLRTTCSMRKEANALKDANVSFGDLYVFEYHLCFDWKVFGFHKQQVMPLTDVVALLRSTEVANTVEVQGKGYSLELTLPEHFEETWNIMEACRRTATAQALQAASAEGGPKTGAVEEVSPEIAEAFGEKLDTARRESSSGARNSLLQMNLTEADWTLFLSGAKHLKYRKGDYVLREGSPTKALYQILRGTVRVELQLKDQPTAVVVGHRGPGEMFGETSLLKAGVATASIVTDSDEAVLVCIDGLYLENLFSSHPKLPGRFFAFLAQYQAKRLRDVTATFSSDHREVAGQHLANVTIDEIFCNPAYMGIFRKFMSRTADEEPQGSAAREEYAMSLAMFEFWMDVQDYRSEPEPAALIEMGERIYAHFIAPDGSMRLNCFEDGWRSDVKSQLASLKASGGADMDKVREARRMYDEAQKTAVRAIEAQCYSYFLSSEHFAYILELKAKEGLVPGLPDFKLIRVLGQGGFGQVLEVVKRDCGKHYAMKVMHKEMMRRCLGSSWRKKIWLEKDLMACLNHPFLVNLSYAFQNTEFLVLVMDLVPAGDLSEFVLTKKRLTAEQVKFVVMEVVCVIAYCHSQHVLYRDLKPENLLIDAAGHVRMIDMGLAARITKKQPKRRSRVGTDCYMAPEVRWAKDRREPYGLSCDWYTVGVLAYEFSAGTVPFAHPEEENPVYRTHEFKDPQAETFIRSLLDQNHTTRLGCGAKGVVEILEHPFWGGIEWDLVPLKKFDSPCRNLKAPAKRKKEKENLAVQIANDISEAEREEPDQEYNVANWDFVSPTAVVEEYMENMYQCVSAI